MDTEIARGRLGEERERLESVRSELAGIRNESQEDGLQELSSYDQHQADVATETFEREKDLSILDQVEGELAAVEDALQRLDDGTYGSCEACGKPIAEERLEAMPATRFCVDDQAMAERENRSSSQGERTTDDA